MIRVQSDPGSAFSRISVVRVESDPGFVYISVFKVLKIPKLFQARIRVNVPKSQNCTQANIVLLMETPFDISIYYTDPLRSSLIPD